MDLGLIVIVLLLAVIGYLIYRNRQLTVELAQHTSKDANKQAILDALADGPMGNEEIRALVGVSARSVVSYMDELEADGKVEQVGETGMKVTYRLKPSHFLKNVRGFDTMNVCRHRGN